MARTVCFDFDGVLAQYDGWKGPEHFGDPLPQMSQVCELLQDRGWQLVVHSTREPLGIKAWLIAHGFPAGIHVTDRKPRAVVYVDDRGLRFEGPPGDATKLVETIESYRTWWEPVVQSLKPYALVPDPGCPRRPDSSLTPEEHGLG